MEKDKNTLKREKYLQTAIDLMLADKDQLIMVIMLNDTHGIRTVCTEDNILVQRGLLESVIDSMKDRRLAALLADYEAEMARSRQFVESVTNKKAKEGGTN